MKKRLLSIGMAACMLIGLIAAGTMVLADDGEYTAILEGELDTNVSSAVAAWGIGEEPGASVGVTIGEEATIKMSFSEPIKFTGNWTGITLDIPIEDDLHAGTSGAKITKFVVDGKDLGSKVVPIIDRDGAGFLCIDIARQWGGSYDPYDLKGMEPFSELEITFIIPNLPTGLSAYIAGELDTSVNSAIGAWDIENYPGARIDFEMGEEATISMSFDEPVKFTGNWTGITTNIWVLGDDDAASTNASIVSFVVDGEDLGSREVPLISRDGGGFLCLDIARQWGGDYDPYGLIGMEPFSEIEITFVIPDAPSKVEDVPEEVELGDIIMEGNAWFGGTFAFSAGHPLADENPDLEPDGCEWYSVTDQSVPFKIGEPFTVTVEAGSGTITHDVATNWDGYALAIDTDNLTAPALLDVYIDSVKLDGNDLYFNEEFAGIGQGDDKGLRVSLTNAWSDAPFASPSEIGTFTKLEVTLAFVEYGAESPFGPSTSTPEPPPPSVDPITPPPASPSTGGDEGGGMPGWVVPVIIVSAVVIIGVVVLVIVKSKGGK